MQFLYTYMLVIERIIPVIDIKDGIAVGAKAGERDDYMELKSILTNSSNPIVISKIYKKIGFKSIYIADLDGIMKSSPNVDLLKRIKWETNLDIMADIGTWSERDIRSIEMAGITPILATETFKSLNLLEFPRKFALGLDIRDNKLLCEMKCDLDDFIEIIKDILTIERIIVIDLNRVGMSSGPNLELCKKIIKKLSDREIIYGGGIRFLLDVEILLKLGVSKVLVGSALHEGRIRVGDLIKAELSE